MLRWAMLWVTTTTERPSSASERNVCMTDFS